MCGIAGWLNWYNLAQRDVVEAMTLSMSHRGPDCHLVKEIGPIIFGHRRLSIIDLNEASNQPMIDTNRNTLIFNGEIYNFLELKLLLEKAGFYFKTKSDTEVILKAYQFWGLSCFEKFNGMFAIALWDDQNQQMILARDRLGEKPLYYCHDKDGGLIFASDLFSLIHHPDVSREISEEALAQYLSFNYILSDKCILKNVYKVEPATFLVYRKKSDPIKKVYWNLAYSFKNKVKMSERDAKDKLLELLDKSVRNRIVADVPVGAFLSGGVDSAAIIASVSKNINHTDFKAFSIGFKEESFDELDDAKYSAQMFNVSHKFKYLDDNLFNDLQALSKIIDEPMADNSILPYYHLSKLASEEVKVVLSGDGADEILGGYDTYVADRIKSLTNWLPIYGFRTMHTLVQRFWPVSFEKVSFDYKVKKFLGGHALQADDAHTFWRTIFSNSDKSSILLPEVWDNVRNVDCMSFIRELNKDVYECHYLDRAMYTDLKTWLPSDILFKSDRATMASSIECRAPFLDHELVEYCAALPVSLKVKGFQKKFLLRKSQKGRLPKNLLKKKKRGFNSPIAHWITGSSETEICDVLFNGHLSNYFQLEMLKKIVTDHKSGKADNSYKIFGLLILAMWLNELKSTPIFKRI